MNNFQGNIDSFKIKSCVTFLFVQVVLYKTLRNNTISAFCHDFLWYFIAFLLPPPLYFAIFAIFGIFWPMVLQYLIVKYINIAFWAFPFINSGKSNNVWMENLEIVMVGDVHGLWNESFLALAHVIPQHCMTSFM